MRRRPVKKKSGRAGKCPSGKVRYRDPASAKTIIAAASRKGNDYRPVRWYRCRDCKGVHLTSQKQG